MENTIVCGRFDEAVNSRVVIYKFVEHENHTPGEIPRQIPTNKENLYACFTSLVQVTATPQAFALADTTVHQDRQVLALFPVPSINYWTYVKLPEWLCKIIRMEECRSWTTMVQSMVVSPSPRHGLVTMSSTTEGTRKKSLQNEFALRAAEGYPGIVSIAWCGLGIKVFTSSPAWARILGDTGAFKVTSEGVPAKGGTLSCFTSKNSPAGRPEWDGTLEGIDRVVRANIFSYPGLIQYMHDFAEERGLLLPHTVLFSMSMASRGTPIKGLGHKCPLTDMYADLGRGGHDETRQQVTGIFMSLRSKFWN